MKKVKVLLGTILAAVLGGAAPAYAEPAASGGHVPVLWAIAWAGALLAAGLPPLARRYWLRGMPGWTAWLLSIVFFVTFLALGGPVIVAIGGILFSGRTM